MPHLRLELGLLLLKSLNSFHQERDLSEGQESCYIRGADSYHPAILVEHLGQRDSAQAGPCRPCSGSRLLQSSYVP